MSTCWKIWLVCIWFMGFSCSDACNSRPMGRIEHGPTFYFEVLALVGFAFSNFDCSIPTCQVEWPITFIRCTMSLFPLFYFFVWLSLMELIFYVFFWCCCIFLKNVLLFGNYGKIIQNFGNFSNLHQKYEVLNFFCHHHYQFSNFWIGYHLTLNKKIIIARAFTQRKKIITFTLLQKVIRAMVTFQK